MFNCLIRTLIIYISIITAMRLLGKRQIGDLQPAELVITILLSDIFSIPLQEPELPMLNMFISVALLVGLELIISFAALKSPKIRQTLSGSFIPVIENGTVNQKNLKLIRFTVDDLTEELRKKDVFSISEVEYAVVETDGTLSVLKKDGGAPEYLLIADGRFIDNAAKKLSLDRNAVEKIVRDNRLEIADVFIMTMDKNGGYNIIKTEAEK